MGLGRKLFTLITLASGAVLGMLFSPRKGSQIRKDLSKKWDKGESGIDVLQKAATKMGEDVATTTKEIYNSKTVQEKKEKLVKGAKEGYQNLKAKAKEVTEDLMQSDTPEENNEQSEKDSK